ncbi:unnamed protein product [Cyclocybe aegerita]|uniref:Uncharacterized protein n=1 Tax=Cyclocybe aegerita TaxID=1973307 RepID=A0A8S0W264_CYCAE|nr:unnamed protein product [Cyclocybe aegerita]
MSYRQGANYNNLTHTSTSSNTFDELKEYPCTFPYLLSSQALQMPHTLLSFSGHHTSYEDFQPAGSGSSFQPFYQATHQYEVAHSGIRDLPPRKAATDVPERGVKRSASFANLDCGATTSRRRQEPLLQLPNNPQPSYELTLPIPYLADINVGFSAEANGSLRVPMSDTINDIGVGFDLVDDQYDWTSMLAQPRIRSESAESIQVEANPSAPDIDLRSTAPPPALKPPRH